MDHPTTLEALRALIVAAQDFEREAAHHRRVQEARDRLREALTRAQLVLSVAKRDRDLEPTVTVGKPLREKSRAAIAHRRRSKRSKR